MPYSPNALGTPRVTGHGPPSGPHPPPGIHDGISSPHGNAAPSTPPRAARSHSASVGRRSALPRRVRHAQYATASCQLTPTTGRSSPSRAGSLQSRGASWPLASRKGRYSPRVTGEIDISNPSTWTRCTGRSSSCPRSLPIRKLPAGIRLNGIAAAAVLPGEPIGEGRREQTEDAEPARQRVRVDLGTRTADAGDDRLGDRLHRLLRAEAADVVPVIPLHRLVELRARRHGIDARHRDRRAGELGAQRLRQP